MNYRIIYPPELCHYGVLGMKWGVRRYQNYDGTRIKTSKIAASSKRGGINRDIENYKNLKANRSARKNMPQNSDERYRSFINSQQSLQEQAKRKADAKVKAYNAENDYDLWEKDYDTWLNNAEKAWDEARMANKKYEEAIKYYNSEERKYLERYLDELLESEYPGQFGKSQKSSSGPKNMWGQNAKYYHKPTEEAIKKATLADSNGLMPNTHTNNGSLKEGMRSELQKHADLAKALVEIPRNSGGKKSLRDQAFGYSSGHYLRNKLNKNLPQNEAEAKKQGWIKLSKKESEMHQFHQEDGVRNSKWISPDGHREVVYTGKGKNQHITTDPRDMGTYNFANPKKNPIGHTVFDVIPYVLVGNSSDDTTSAVQRLMDPARSLIGDTKLAKNGEKWVAARTRRG